MTIRLGEYTITLREGGEHAALHRGGVCVALWTPTSRLFMVQRLWADYDPALASGTR